MNRLSLKTCCFTGHRTIPVKEIDTVVNNLNKAVLELIYEEFTHFLSGGAIGFDLLAASLILTLKQQGHPITLEFVIPHENHCEYWNEKQRLLFHNLCAEADAISVLAEKHFDGCVKKRNHHMVNHSTVCISYLRKSISGTGQTVRYAVRNQLHIIRL